MSRPFNFDMDSVVASVAKSQQKMRLQLIPPYSILLESDPAFPSDKIEENDRTRLFVTQMNTLLNYLNKIRTWRQNNASLSEYFRNCEKDYDEISALTDEMYYRMPTFRMKVCSYISDVLCRALSRGLTSTQLKNEIKPLYVPIFTQFKVRIENYSTEMLQRTHCPTCRKYVKKIRGHTKRCRLPDAQILQNERRVVERDRAFFSTLSKIRYDNTVFHKFFL